MARRVVVLIAIVLLGAGALTAVAASPDAVASGRALAARVAGGDVRCADLSPGDLDHLGEYVMGRMVGSPASHEALDARMTVMMGARGEERMHDLMGARWAGCPIADEAGVPAQGMMGAGAAAATPWDSMMGSATWGWMHDGRWQRMSRGDWERLGDRWMGSGMMAGTGGWSATGVALVVLAGLAAAAAIAVGVILLAGRRRDGDGHSPPPAPGAPAP